MSRLLGLGCEIGWGGVSHVTISKVGVGDRDRKKVSHVTVSGVGVWDRGGEECHMSWFLGLGWEIGIRKDMQSDPSSVRQNAPTQVTHFNTTLRLLPDCV